MMSAHRTGRGVVGYFETAEEAEDLRSTLATIDKRSQEVWLQQGGFAQATVVGACGGGVCGCLWCVGGMWVVCGRGESVGGG